MDERTKRIWRGLVNYANATAIDFNEFVGTVANCMGWVVATQPFSLLNFPGDDYIRGSALKYQASVRALLRWLCSAPDSDERDEVEDKAWDFLDRHTKHIGGVRLEPVSGPQHKPENFKKFNYTPTEIERFVEEASRYWAGEDAEGNSPLRQYAPTRDYEDLADPICDFLLTEYQKWRNTEYARKDRQPAPPVPVFVCPNCDKLVMPERVGRRKYCPDCSDKARAKSYLEKASPDENKDYQWLYRLQKYDPGTRRARLRQTKVQERLGQIIERQKNSTRCQNLIHEMRLHVAPTNET